MLVERSRRSTGSFLRLAETAGRISLRGVRFGPPVSALASFTVAPFSRCRYPLYTGCTILVYVVTGAWSCSSCQFHHAYGGVWG